MRIKVFLKGNENQFYPFNYNKAIRSLIYNIVVDNCNNGINFNYFTFSNLIIEKFSVNDGGLFSKSGIISFYISSPDDNFIRRVVNGLCCLESIQLCNNHLQVYKIEFVENPNFSKNNIFSFKSLSPIMVRSSMNFNNQYKQIDLSPDNNLFFSRLRNNLISKYCQFYNLKNCNGNLKILNWDCFKSKRISVLNNGHRLFNRAYFLNLDVKGDTKLLNFAWNIGLGEKNNLGFGMIE